MSESMIAPRLIDSFFHAVAKGQIQCDLSLTDRAVLSVLGARIGCHESSYMTHSYIGQYLNISWATVARSISRLKSKNYINVIKIKTKAGCCNQYEIGEVIHNLISSMISPHKGGHITSDMGVISPVISGVISSMPVYNTNILQTKQREDARRRRATPLPVDNFDTEDTIQLAKELGLDHTKELLKFRAHSMAKGTKNIDWSSAFKKWLLDSIDHTVRTIKTAPRQLPQEQSRHYPTIDEIRAQSPEPKGGREQIAAQVHALAAKLRGGRMNGHTAH